MSADASGWCIGGVYWEEQLEKAIGVGGQRLRSIHTRQRGKKMRGEKPTCYLSPQLHAIGNHIPD